MTYTPTTDEVRDAYGYWSDSGPHAPPDEFNRWLAAHDAEVAAQALRDYAKGRYLDFLEAPDLPWPDQPEGMARDYARAAAELMAHADRIARAEQTKEDR